MSIVDEQTLLWPPAAGTEVGTLVGSLERQRRTFAWKCGGPDHLAPTARPPASAGCSST